VDELDDMFIKLKFSSEDIKRYKQTVQDIEHPPQWFVQVVRLSAGKSFGELALINDAPRAASIQCLTTCLFATLERKDYEKVLK